MRTATDKDYREAARMIAEGEENRCCNAIGVSIPATFEVADYYGAPLFHELYQDNADSPTSWWISSVKFPDTQQYRVIALLLAAEIWKDENGKK